MAERYPSNRTEGGLNQSGDKQCWRCEWLRLRIHAGHPVIKGRRCIPQACFFKLHWDIDLINPATDRSGRNVRKAKRLAMCENLAKYASALMNSHGGTILIHIDGLSQGDFYLGYLDEMVAEKLNSLLERGQLYSNAFKAVPLGKLDSRYREYVLFCVNGSSRFVTQALNTSVALDDRILEASAEAVSEILISKTETKKMSPKVRGTHFSQESREIQFKRFKPPSFLEEELMNNTEKTALYIWKELGLREYLTAFAKLPEGGSYFLGVGEKEKILQRYKTKTIELEGIPKGFVDTRVIRHLEQYFRNSTLFCNYSGRFIRPDPSNFMITVHYNDIGKTILECSIAPMNGILFYEGTGPVSYKVDNGQLKQVKPKEWHDAMTKKGKTDGTAKHYDRTPSEPRKNLDRRTAEVAKRLITRVSELSEENDDGSTESCFAYVEESIRTSLNLSLHAIIPLEIICEAVILIPHRFGLVLTVCRDSRPSENILTYNCQLGRDLSEAVRLHTRDNFIFFTEVVSDSDISSGEVFTKIMTDLETYAHSICIPDMFVIRRQTFKSLISAIGVCSIQGNKNRRLGDRIQNLISALRVCNNLSKTMSKRVMEIAADVDDLEQDKRLTKVICAGTGLIGAAMSISGIVLGPAGLPLTLIGAVVGVGGGVGELTVSLVVKSKTKDKIQEAQKLLKKYEDVSRNLQHEMNVEEIKVLASALNVANRALLFPLIDIMGDIMDDIVLKGLKISKFVGVFLSALLVPFDVYKLISNVVDLIERRPSAVAAQLRSMANEMENISKDLDEKIPSLAAILDSL